MNQSIKVLACFGISCDASLRYHFVSWRKSDMIVHSFDRYRHRRHYHRCHSHCHHHYHTDCQSHTVGDWNLEQSVRFDEPLR
jgi:hypothetical protein